MKERNGTRRSRTGKTEEGKTKETKETIWVLYPDADVPPGSYRRATGQCRLVLSINKHLELVALPAGLRLPQAVFTKQTSPLWLNPNPHKYTLISCVLVRIPGLTKVTSGVTSAGVDRILLKWVQFLPLVKHLSLRCQGHGWSTLHSLKHFRKGKSLNRIWLTGFPVS